MLGAADFAWADGMRRGHFPPERNFVPAHITLFHHLPPSVLDELSWRIKQVCAGPAPAAMLADVLLLGSAVAYHVVSDELMAIRDALADAFHGLLVPQDQVRPRLHITVQNKADPAQARSLAGQLRRDFRPRPLKIAGLGVWRYLGGPWQLALKARFRG